MMAFNLGNFDSGQLLPKRSDGLPRTSEIDCSLELFNYNSKNKSFTKQNDEISNLAERLKRCIAFTPKRRRESKEFASELRKKLYSLHQICSECVKDTGKFPARDSIADLLVEYINLLTTPLLTKPQPDEESENVEKALIFILLLMRSCPSGKKQYEIRQKFAISVLKKATLMYKDNPFITRMMLKLLNKLDLIDELKKSTTLPVHKLWGNPALSIFDDDDGQSASSEDPIIESDIEEEAQNADLEDKLNIIHIVEDDVAPPVVPPIVDSCRKVPTIEIDEDDDIDMLYVADEVESTRNKRESNSYVPVFDAVVKTENLCSAIKDINLNCSKPQRLISNEVVEILDDDDDDEIPSKPNVNICDSVISVKRDMSAFQKNQFNLNIANPCDIIDILSDDEDDTNIGCLVKVDDIPSDTEDSILDKYITDDYDIASCSSSTKCEETTELIRENCANLVLTQEVTILENEENTLNRCKVSSIENLPNESIAEGEKISENTIQELGKVYVVELSNLRDVGLPIESDENSSVDITNNSEVNTTEKELMLNEDTTGTSTTLIAIESENVEVYEKTKDVLTKHDQILTKQTFHENITNPECLKVGHEVEVSSTDLQIQNENDSIIQNQDDAISTELLTEDITDVVIEEQQQTSKNNILHDEFLLKPDCEKNGYVKENRTTEKAEVCQLILSSQNENEELENPLQFTNTQENSLCSKEITLMGAETLIIEDSKKISRELDEPQIMEVEESEVEIITEPNHIIKEGTSLVAMEETIDVDEAAKPNEKLVHTITCQEEGYNEIITNDHEIGAVVSSNEHSTIQTSEKEENKEQLEKDKNYSHAEPPNGIKERSDKISKVIGNSENSSTQSSPIDEINKINATSECSHVEHEREVIVDNEGANNKIPLICEEKTEEYQPLKSSNVYMANDHIQSEELTDSSQNIRKNSIEELLRTKENDTNEDLFLQRTDYYQHLNTMDDIYSDSDSSMEELSITDDYIPFEDKIYECETLDVAKELVVSCNIPIQSVEENNKANIANTDMLSANENKESEFLTTDIESETCSKNLKLQATVPSVLQENGCINLEVTEDANQLTKELNFLNDLEDAKRTKCISPQLLQKGSLEEIIKTNESSCKVPENIKPSADLEAVISESIQPIDVVEECKPTEKSTVLDTSESPIAIVSDIENKTEIGESEGNFLEHSEEMISSTTSMNSLSEKSKVAIDSGETITCAQKENVNDKVAEVDPKETSQYENIDTCSILNKSENNLMEVNQKKEEISVCMGGISEENEQTATCENLTDCIEKLDSEESQITMETTDEEMITQEVNDEVHILNEKELNLDVNETVDIEIVENATSVNEGVKYGHDINLDSCIEEDIEEIIIEEKSDFFMNHIDETMDSVTSDSCKNSETYKKEEYNRSVNDKVFAADPLEAVSNKHVIENEKIYANTTENNMDVPLGMVSEDSLTKYNSLTCAIENSVIRSENDEIFKETCVDNNTHDIQQEENLVDETSLPKQACANEDSATQSENDDASAHVNISITEQSTAKIPEDYCPQKIEINVKSVETDNIEEVCNKSKLQEVTNCDSSDEPKKDLKQCEDVNEEIIQDNFEKCDKLVDNSIMEVVRDKELQVESGYVTEKDQPKMVTNDKAQDISALSDSMSDKNDCKESIESETENIESPTYELLSPKRSKCASVIPVEEDEGTYKLVCESEGKSEEVNVNKVSAEHRNVLVEYDKSKSIFGILSTDVTAVNDSGFCEESSIESKMDNKVDFPENNSTNEQEQTDTLKDKSVCVESVTLKESNSYATETTSEINIPSAINNDCETTMNIVYNNDQQEQFNIDENTNGSENDLIIDENSNDSTNKNNNISTALPDVNGNNSFKLCINENDISSEKLISNTISNTLSFGKVQDPLDSDVVSTTSETDRLIIDEDITCSPIHGDINANKSVETTLNIENKELLVKNDAFNAELAPIETSKVVDQPFSDVENNSLVLLAFAADKQEYLSTSNEKSPQKQPSKRRRKPKTAATPRSSRRVTRSTSHKELNTIATELQPIIDELEAYSDEEDVPILLKSKIKAITAKQEKKSKNKSENVSISQTSEGKQKTKNKDKSKPKSLQKNVENDEIVDIESVEDEQIECSNLVKHDQPPKKSKLKENINNKNDLNKEVSNIPPVSTSKSKSTKMKRSKSSSSESFDAKKLSSPKATKADDKIKPELRKEKALAKDHSKNHKSSTCKSKSLENLVSFTNEMETTKIKQPQKTAPTPDENAEGKEKKKEKELCNHQENLKDNHASKPKQKIVKDNVEQTTQVAPPQGNLTEIDQNIEDRTQKIAKNNVSSERDKEDGKRTKQRNKSDVLKNDKELKKKGDDSKMYEKLINKKEESRKKEKSSLLQNKRGDEETVKDTTKIKEVPKDKDKIKEKGLSKDKDVSKEKTTSKDKDSCKHKVNIKEAQKEKGLSVDKDISNDQVKEKVVPNDKGITKDETNEKEKLVAKDKEVIAEKEISKNKDLPKEKEVLKDKYISKDKIILKDKSSPKDKGLCKEKEVLKDKTKLKENMLKIESKKETKEEKSLKDSKENVSAISKLEQLENKDKEGKHNKGRDTKSSFGKIEKQPKGDKESGSETNIKSSKFDVAKKKISEDLRRSIDNAKLKRVTVTLEKMSETSLSQCKKDKTDENRIKTELSKSVASEEPRRKSKRLADEGLHFNDVDVPLSKDKNVESKVEHRSKQRKGDKPKEPETPKKHTSIAEKSSTKRKPCGSSKKTSNSNIIKKDEDCDQSLPQINEKVLPSTPEGTNPITNSFENTVVKQSVNFQRQMSDICAPPKKRKYPPFEETAPHPKKRRRYTIDDAILYENVDIEKKDIRRSLDSMTAIVKDEKISNQSDILKYTECIDVIAQDKLVSQYNKIDDLKSTEQEIVGGACQKDESTGNEHEASKVFVGATNLEDKTTSDQHLEVENSEVQENVGGICQKDESAGNAHEASKIFVDVTNLEDKTISDQYLEVENSDRILIESAKELSDEKVLPINLTYDYKKQEQTEEVIVNEVGTMTINNLPPEEIKTNEGTQSIVNDPPSDDTQNTTPEELNISEKPPVNEFIVDNMKQKTDDNILHGSETGYVEQLPEITDVESENMLISSNEDVSRDLKDNGQFSSDSIPMNSDILLDCSKEKINEKITLNDVQIEENVVIQMETDEIHVKETVIQHQVVESETIQSSEREDELHQSPTSNVELNKTSDTTDIISTECEKSVDDTENLKHAETIVESEKASENNLMEIEDSCLNKEKELPVANEINMEVEYKEKELVTEVVTSLENANILNENIQAVEDETKNNTEVEMIATSTDTNSCMECEEPIHKVNEESAVVIENNDIEDEEVESNNLTIEDNQKMNNSNYVQSTENAISEHVEVSAVTIENNNVHDEEVETNNLTIEDNKNINDSNYVETTDNAISEHVEVSAVITENSVVQDEDVETNNLTIEDNKKINDSNYVQSSVNATSEHFGVSAVIIENNDVQDEEVATNNLTIEDNKNIIDSNYVQNTDNATLEHFEASAVIIENNDVQDEEVATNNLIIEDNKKINDSNDIQCTDNATSEHFEASAVIIENNDVQDEEVETNNLTIEDNKKINDSNDIQSTDNAKSEHFGVSPVIIENNDVQDEEVETNNLTIEDNQKMNNSNCVQSTDNAISEHFEVSAVIIENNDAEDGKVETNNLTTEDNQKIDDSNYTQSTKNTFSEHFANIRNEISENTEANTEKHDSTVNNQTCEEKRSNLVPIEIPAQKIEDETCMECEDIPTTDIKTDNVLQEMQPFEKASDILTVAFKQCKHLDELTEEKQILAGCAESKEICADIATSKCFIALPPPEEPTKSDKTSKNHELTKPYLHNVDCYSTETITVSTESRNANKTEPKVIVEKIEQYYGINNDLVKNYSGLNEVCHYQRKDACNSFEANLAAENHRNKIHSHGAIGEKTIVAEENGVLMKEHESTMTIFSECEKNVMPELKEDTSSASEPMDVQPSLHVEEKKVDEVLQKPSKYAVADDLINKKTNLNSEYDLSEHMGYHRDTTINQTVIGETLIIPEDHIVENVNLINSNISSVTAGIVRGSPKNLPTTNLSNPEIDQIKCEEPFNHSSIPQSCTEKIIDDDDGLTLQTIEVQEVYSPVVVDEDIMVHTSDREHVKGSQGMDYDTLNPETYEPIQSDRSTKHEDADVLCKDVFEKSDELPEELRNQSNTATLTYQKIGSNGGEIGGPLLSGKYNKPGMKQSSSSSDTHIKESGVDNVQNDLDNSPTASEHIFNLTEDNNLDQLATAVLVDDSPVDGAADFTLPEPDGQLSFPFHYYNLNAEERFNLVNCELPDIDSFAYTTAQANLDGNCEKKYPGSETAYISQETADLVSFPVTFLETTNEDESSSMENQFGHTVDKAWFITSSHDQKPPTNDLPLATEKDLDAAVSSVFPDVSLENANAENDIPLSVQMITSDIQSVEESSSKLPGAEGSVDLSPSKYINSLPNLTSLTEILDSANGNVSYQVFTKGLEKENANVVEEKEKKQNSVIGNAFENISHKTSDERKKSLDAILNLQATQNSVNHSTPKKSPRTYSRRKSVDIKISTLDASSEQSNYHVKLPRKAVNPRKAIEESDVKMNLISKHNTLINGDLDEVNLQPNALASKCLDSSENITLMPSPKRVKLQTPVPVNRNLIISASTEVMSQELADQKLGEAKDIPPPSESEEVIKNNENDFVTENLVLSPISEENVGASNLDESVTSNKTVCIPSASEKIKLPSTFNEDTHKINTSLEENSVEEELIEPKINSEVLENDSVTENVVEVSVSHEVAAEMEGATNETLNSPPANIEMTPDALQESPLEENTSPSSKLENIAETAAVNNLTMEDLTIPSTSGDISQGIIQNNVNEENNIVPSSSSGASENLIQHNFTEEDNAIPSNSEGMSQSFVETLTGHLTTVSVTEECINDDRDQSLSVERILSTVDSHGECAAQNINGRRCSKECCRIDKFTDFAISSLLELKEDCGCLSNTKHICQSRTAQHTQTSGHSDHSQTSEQPHANTSAQSDSNHPEISTESQNPVFPFANLSLHDLVNEEPSYPPRGSDNVLQNRQQIQENILANQQLNLDNLQLDRPQPADNVFQNRQKITRRSNTQNVVNGEVFFENRRPENVPQNRQLRVRRPSSDMRTIIAVANDFQYDKKITGTHKIPVNKPPVDLSTVTNPNPIVINTQPASSLGLQRRIVLPNRVPNVEQVTRGIDPENYMQRRNHRTKVSAPPKLDPKTSTSARRTVQAGPSSSEYSSIAHRDPLIGGITSPSTSGLRSPSSNGIANIAANGITGPLTKKLSGSLTTGLRISLSKGHPLLKGTRYAMTGQESGSDSANKHGTLLNNNSTLELLHNDRWSRTRGHKTPPINGYKIPTNSGHKTPPASDYMSPPSRNCRTPASSGRRTPPGNEHTPTLNNGRESVSRDILSEVTKQLGLSPNDRLSPSPPSSEQRITQGNGQEVLFNYGGTDRLSEVTERVVLQTSVRHEPLSMERLSSPRSECTVPSSSKKNFSKSGARMLPILIGKDSGDTTIDDCKKVSGTDNNQDKNDEDKDKVVIEERVCAKVTTESAPTLKEYKKPNKYDDVIKSLPLSSDYFENKYDSIKRRSEEKYSKNKYMYKIDAGRSHSRTPKRKRKDDDESKNKKSKTDSPDHNTSTKYKRKREDSASDYESSPCQSTPNTQITTESTELVFERLLREYEQESREKSREEHKRSRRMSSSTDSSDCDKSTSSKSGQRTPHRKLDGTSSSFSKRQPANSASSALIKDIKLSSVNKETKQVNSVKMDNTSFDDKKVCKVVPQRRPLPSHSAHPPTSTTPAPPQAVRPHSQPAPPGRYFSSGSRTSTHSRPPNSTSSPSSNGRYSSSRSRNSPSAHRSSSSSSVSRSSRSNSRHAAERERISPREVYVLGQYRASPGPSQTLPREARVTYWTQHMIQPSHNANSRSNDDWLEKVSHLLPSTANIFFFPGMNYMESFGHYGGRPPLLTMEAIPKK